MSLDFAIELEAVRARRGGRVVLEGVTLSVATGERVALVGGNGVGKSTLIDVVLGLVPVDGRVRVLGAPPPVRSIGFVGQDPDASLLPWLSVRHNVELPLRLRGVPASERARAFDAVRSWLDPNGRIDPSREPRALSGGERQLVGLMRAWIGAPRLLVLDEPLSAIDPVARVRTREAITRGCARAPETTLLFVTHDLGDVAALACRALVLGGRPAAIRADVAVERGDATGVLRALEDVARSSEEPSRDRQTVEAHAALGTVGA